MRWIRLSGVLIATLGLSNESQGSVLDLLEGLGTLGDAKSCGCAASCHPQCCRPTISRPCDRIVHTYQRQISHRHTPCCKSRCCASAPECCIPVSECCHQAPLVGTYHSECNSQKCPICISTCFTPPTQWCFCQARKCCPPEVKVSCCQPCETVLYTPPPSHKPQAPPMCCCKVNCCNSGH